MPTKEVKYRIAIIEDDMVLSKAISEKLIQSDFDVIPAYDGEEGLQLVLREKPDLILLDIVMPKMDGMSFLKKISFLMSKEKVNEVVRLCHKRWIEEKV